MAIAYNSAYVQTETLNFTFTRVGHVDGGDSLAREASTLVVSNRLVFEQATYLLLTFSQTRLTA